MGIRSTRAAHLAFALMVLSAPCASAAVLYLGAPGGGSSAYTTRDARFPWLRVKYADLPDVGYLAQPALADLDGDGVADVLIGGREGAVQAFRNAGSGEAPRWERRTDWDPPSATGGAAPALADLDGDGDADLLVGDGSGTLAAFENTGGDEGPKWEEHKGWNVVVAASRARPALGDFDGDGRPDLLVGTAAGDLLAFVGTDDRGTPFSRAPAWDAPAGGESSSPALGDMDGDGRLDLFISNGTAHSAAFRNTGSGWEDASTWGLGDTGSGPVAPALASGELNPKPPPPPGGGGGGGGGGGSVDARVMASALTGTAPLHVTLDASKSSGPSDTTLVFAWDFGDGTPTPPPAPGVDAGAMLKAGADGYNDAKSERDNKHFSTAVQQYLAVVAALVPLTVVEDAGPIKVQGTNRIDRVARWYLQKTAHDLGGIYLFHDVDDVTGCERFETSLQYLRESVAQAIAGGFPNLPASNGTTNDLASALKHLEDAGCDVPPPMPMFPPPGALPETGAVIEHVYERAGTYVARVTVTAGSSSDVAEVTITVADDQLPPPPGGPSDNDSDALEGFGASTPGGSGGRVISVREPTEAAVRAAISSAAGGHTIVRFETTVPIPIRKSLPELEGDFITVEGNAATLYVPSGYANLIDVRGHDVIVRNIRLRNGADNLRATADGAYNVVFSHVSSTGSGDDAISIAKDAHDVTIQWSFFAGNTRSLFFKYGDTTNISVHHTWIMKQWARGPLVSGNTLADLRNLIVEDWTLWGARFESGSSGNLVNSLFVLSPYARSVGGKENGALVLKQRGSVFTSGNVYEGLADRGEDGDATAPLSAAPVKTLPVSDVRQIVRQRAGCLPRDSVDQAYIERSGDWDVTESRPLRLTPGS